MPLVCKAADDIRVTIFLRYFGGKKLRKFVVTGNKLTCNFVLLLASGLCGYGLWTAV
jgi:hypothetical protein